MTRVEFVGPGDDSEHIVVVNEAGERYDLPVTDSLRTLVNAPRPAPESTPLTPKDIQRRVRAGQSAEDIAVTVAHHDGNFQADAETLDRLEGDGRVAFRYTEAVNGSARNIAGILNAQGNVLGMMPHPERVVEDAHGGTDGRRLFEGLLEAVA